MKQYAGIDVSLEASSVCVVDAEGKILRESKVVSEPEALIAWFKALGAPLERIGLEAGPLSQWLHAAMAQAGLAVELLETRHVRTAFKTMPVKTDKKDARGIAQLMRLGWFRPVHCKSLPAQEVRAVLTARKLLQSKLHDVEMCIRGILRGFGLKVGPTTPRPTMRGSEIWWRVIRRSRRSPTPCLLRAPLSCRSFAALKNECAISPAEMIEHAD